VVNRFDTTQKFAPLRQHVCTESFQPEVSAFGQPVARFNDAFKPAIWHGGRVIDRIDDDAIAILAVFSQKTPREPRR
jgi:hypothetical protein